MNNLQHTAKITKISNNRLTLQLCRSEACAVCQIKDACHIQKSSQTIDIDIDNPQDFSLNQQIMLEISTQTGILAMLLAYILPLILMLSTLLTCYIFTYNDLTSGICAIIILVPYYLIVSGMQKYINPKFNFKILKK